MRVDWRGGRMVDGLWVDLCHLCKTNFVLLGALATLGVAGLGKGHGKLWRRGWSGSSGERRMGARLFTGLALVVSVFERKFLYREQIFATVVNRLW
jgi:hypothetical protein